MSLPLEETFPVSAKNNRGMEEQKRNEKESTPISLFLKQKHYQTQNMTDQT